MKAMMSLLMLMSAAFLLMSGVTTAQELPEKQQESQGVNDLQETTNWDLLEDLLLYHNAIRYFHNASALRFNRTLTDFARLKALIYAWYDGNAPEDSGDFKFAEIAHWSPNDEVDADDVIEDWYFEEEPKWNYDQPQLSEETHAFSQIVWNSTERVGCGQAQSNGKKGGTYTVCYYEPIGNIAGLEKENVFRPNYEDQETTPTSSGDSSGALVTPDSLAEGNSIKEQVLQEKSFQIGLRSMIDFDGDSGDLAEKGLRLFSTFNY